MKNNKAVVSVKLFGEFSIEYKSQILAYDDMRSEMVTKLLAYILVNNSKTISVQELIDVLWVDDEIINPVGALKNLVYRLRNILKSKLGDEQFILSSRGTYSWNPKYTIELDTVNIEQLYYKSKDSKLVKTERISLLKKMMSLYTGSIFKVIASQHWVIQMEAYYRSMYIRGVEELISLYKEDDKYKEINDCCNIAIAVESLEEEFYYQKIKAMIRLGNRKEAHDYYEKSKAYLCEKLGIHEPTKLLRVYDELSNKIQVNNASIDDINVEMNNQHDKGNKTFMCDYNVVFREIYRLEQRRMERLGISEYMVLFTIGTVNGDINKGETVVKYLKEATKYLCEAIENSLRSGDVASRCSELQYVVLLPDCPEHNVDDVAVRIINNYIELLRKNRIYTVINHHNIRIFYDVKSINKENLLV
jgi:DNA-binding SARP family transcriptional activator